MYFIIFVVLYYSVLGSIKKLRSHLKVFLAPLPSMYTSYFFHFVLDPISSSTPLGIDQKFGQYLVMWMMI